MDGNLARLSSRGDQAMSALVGSMDLSTVRDDGAEWAVPAFLQLCHSSRAMDAAGGDATDAALWHEAERLCVSGRPANETVRPCRGAA